MVENEDKKNRKRKGGAEKLRDKKMKALEADAPKCKKIAFLFPSIDTVSACTIKDNNNNIVSMDTTNTITPSAEIIESDEEQDSNMRVYDELSTVQNENRNAVLVKELEETISLLQVIQFVLYNIVIAVVPLSNLISIAPLFCTFYRISLIFCSLTHFSNLYNISLLPKGFQHVISRNATFYHALIT